MRTSRRTQLVLPTTVLCLIPFPPSCLGQVPTAPPANKPPVGPRAPQSTHYPILLLAFGNDPDWSLRIGQKGPERLDRPGYPPIPLDAAEVTHEATADSWTYHAKDSATGAAVAVHLTREPCTDATTDPFAAQRPPIGKFTFRASVDHAQLGTLKGCARIAAELFPKISNQADDDEDDDKKKPSVPTIAHFKPPIAVAYLNSAGNVVLSRGASKKIVAPSGAELSLSHDGKKLLYTRSDSKTSPERTMVLYDFDSGRSTSVVQGLVRQAFWSPDDTRLAFMRFVEGKWYLWLTSVASPENATSSYPGAIISIHGWVDAHTILVDDLQQLHWVNDDGTTQQTLSEKDIFGDSFGFSSANTFRVHPLNPDLLLITAEWLKPPEGVLVNDHMGGGAGFFLYETRSKRRVVLSPLNMFVRNAEWSRDGLQIFFTGTDSSGRTATYRIFWDGSGFERYVAGSSLVVGQ